MERRLIRACLAFALLILTALTPALALGSASAVAPAVREPAAAVADSTPVFGINFVSSAEDRAPGSGRDPQSLERQYQNGLATGATWNRWPIYWFNIEQSPDSFDWLTQDATVLADIAHGLQINAILLGTPGFYTTGDQIAVDSESERGRPGGRPGGIYLTGPARATPVGLYEPVFSDGTDVPGPGKFVNPANKWARFVNLTIDRYRPGGVLAQSNGWPTGVGVTHWEMWNEPDLDIFWDASLEDFARLQKVGYLAAKQTDPSAVVLFGALANNSAKPNYYADVLSIYNGDAVAAEHGYFHDILATHSYFHAWKSWYHVYRARGAMNKYGLDKPIWLNETGVTAWDDYPGPVWDPQSALRATTAEQADYTIQTAFYGLFAGADAVFHFQLYDGCGNQPQGTDFPPHNSELCTAEGELIGMPGFPCAGDANGLFTNPTDAACFTQHPTPETARPNRDAFQVLTTYLTDVEPYWRKRPGEPGVCPDQLQPWIVERNTPPQEWVAFYREATGERIVAMWALCERDETAVIDATSPDGRATVVGVDGSTRSIAAVNGFYTIELPAATNRNPFGSEGVNGLFPIGGRPVILVEKDDRLPPELPFRSLQPVIISAESVAGE